jgi:MRG
LREFEKFLRCTEAPKNNSPGERDSQQQAHSFVGVTPLDGSYNVFQTSGNHGKKQFFLYLQEPIEKGQTVELRFLAREPPRNPESKDFDCNQRHWLQEEIAQLSLKQLRDLLDHLNEMLGGHINRKLQNFLKPETAVDDARTQDSADATRVLIARRRMHWVVLRISEQLQSALKQNTGSSMSVIMPPVSAAPLWTSEVVSSLKSLPNWKTSSLYVDLKREAEREILAEFSSKEFGEFSTTRKIWCPMAERLFQNAVDLFSCFLVELESFCDEEKFVNDLCSLVSTAVLKVDSLVKETSIEASKFTDVMLTYKKGTLHSSDALPLMDDVLQASTSQAYVEAMSLCDEPPCKPPARDNFRVVATILKEKSGENEAVVRKGPVVMQSIDEMKASSSVLDRTWYIERQILAIVETVSLCGSANLANRNGGYRCLAKIESRLLAAAQNAAGDDRVSMIALKERPEKKVMEVVLAPGNCRPTIYEPHSAPFFLGLVWPLLSLAGWKLDVGTAPYDVTYLLPGRNKGNDKQARLLKQERARQRGKLARQTSALGFHYIPKRSKRLFVNVSAVDENLFGTEANCISAKEALDRFLVSVQARLPDDDLVSQKQAEAAVDHISTCFDELAPMVLYDDEKDKYEVQADQRLCDAYSCDILVRLLLVMPSMLQQSGLAIDELNTTLGVIRELADFLAVNHHDFLDSSFHVPREFYENESTVPPFLVPHLSNSRETKESPTKRVPLKREASTDVDSTEVVLPSDRADLTDFVAFVMSQTAVCRATQEDIERKNRRVPVGFPGIGCRHCMGFGFAAGKFFFSSTESLTTACTVVEKHLQKCPKVDDDIKSKMAEYRNRHGEQRKDMPQGTQGAFFARLWDRLRSSRASAGSKPDLYVSLLSEPPTEASSSRPGSPGPSSTGPDESGDGSLSSDTPSEFKNHILLMNYLQNTSPWDEQRELMDAIELYYNCLDYGGRIYNTSAMPIHFNSEWLLSKVVPPSRATGSGRR